jgi:hypothetical protein
MRFGSEQTSRLSYGRTCVGVLYSVQAALRKGRTLGVVFCQNIHLLEKGTSNWCYLRLIRTAGGLDTYLTYGRTAGVVLSTTFVASSQSLRKGQSIKTNSSKLPRPIMFRISRHCLVSKGNVKPWNKYLFRHHTLNVGFS